MSAYILDICYGCGDGGSWYFEYHREWGSDGNDSIGLGPRSRCDSGSDARTPGDYVYMRSSLPLKEVQLVSLHP